MPCPGTCHYTPHPSAWPGVLPTESTLTARGSDTRLRTPGPETAEGQVSGKTHKLPESLPQCSFGCILFNT